MPENYSSCTRLGKRHVGFSLLWRMIAIMMTFVSKPKLNSSNNRTLKQQWEKCCQESNKIFESIDESPGVHWLPPWTFAEGFRISLDGGLIGSNLRIHSNEWLLRSFKGEMTEDEKIWIESYIVTITPLAMVWFSIVIEPLGKTGKDFTDFPNEPNGRKFRLPSLGRAKSFIYHKFS